MVSGWVCISFETYLRGGCDDVCVFSAAAGFFLLLICMMMVMLVY